MTDLQKLTKKQKRLRKDLNEVNSEIRRTRLEHGRALTPATNLLINKICKQFCLTREDILSNARDNELQLPRRLLFYILRYKYNFTLIYIGIIFSRNHPSVMYGLKQFEKERQDNKYINDLIKVFYE